MYLNSVKTNRYRLDLYWKVSKLDRVEKKTQIDNENKIVLIDS